MVTSVYAVPSGSSTSRKVRRIGSCQQTSGLVSSGCMALPQRQAVQRAALAAGEAGPVQEDAGALVHGGLAVALVVGLDPGVLARRAGCVELPGAPG